MIATATVNGQFPPDPRQAAEIYLLRGRIPVPVWPQTKIPIGRGWKALRPTAADLDRLFPAGAPRNVGLLLGEPSGGLIDIDLDCPEAIRAAPGLLPPTGWISGRMGRPQSHWWYTVADPPDKGKTTYKDVNKSKMILEVGSTGGKAVAPPGEHETGERIVWHTFQDPAEVAIEDLMSAASATAAAALLARHWPGQGSRQDAALALAGGLLRAGWDSARAEGFLRAVVTAAVDDEIDKRLQVIPSTAETIERGEAVTGWPRLAEMLGTSGKAVVSRSRKWLGIRAGGGAEGDAPRKSVATRLIELALAAKVELFHTPAQAAYASFPVGDHRETWPLRSTGFRRWLGRLLYQMERRGANGQALADALGVLEGQALFDGPEIPVAVRVSEHDGRLYLDLADQAWRAVEIDAAGWRVVDRPPVRFRRPKGLLPLPEPRRGGRLDDLRPFLNLANDDSWRLLVGWMTAAIRGRGPFPVQVLTGEQGSAKTTLGKLIRSILDPSVTPLRCEPRDARDLMIAATNGWLVAFDNLSHLPQWLSDALCRLATGGGFGTRLLYTDDEEVLFDAMRPVMLTSITDVVTSGDLLDRASHLALEPIPDDRRRTEAQLWSRFEAARPRILGGLLDAVSAGLRELPAVRLPGLPRMADFALWAEAVGRGLGWEHGAFLQSYAANRAEINAVALDASPVTPALLGLLDDGPFEGTATELLDRLNGQASESAKKQRGWPGRGNLLTGILRRLAPNLRRVGVAVEFHREPHSGRRAIRIARKRGVFHRHHRHPDPDSEHKSYSANDLGGDDAPEAGSSPDRHPIVTRPSPGAGDDGGDDGVTIPDPDHRHPITPGGQSTCGTDRPSGDDGDDEIHPLSHRTPDGIGYVVVRRPEGLPLVQAALVAAERVGLDLETTGLDPRSDQIRLLSLAVDTCDGGTFVYLVDCFAADPAPLFERLAERELVAHHAAFDLGFLMRLGFTPGPVRCTMLADQLIHAGEQVEHTLAAAVERELGRPLAKALQCSDWSGSLSVDQLAYAATDAAVLLPLVDALGARIQADGLAEAAAIEMRCLPAMVWLAGSGVPLDTDAWRASAVAAEVEAERLAAELDQMAPPDQGMMFTTRRWDSPAQIKTVFEAMGHPLASTGDEALAEVNHPLAAKLRAYRAAAKLATTYGADFLRHVAPDGRVYAGWRQIGSRAGRMSCTRPNMQQLPRDRAYRRCIAAPDGRVLVKADYSQIELRIAAKVSGDGAMLGAYIHGADLHTLTAQRVLGLAEVTQGHRQLAKAINFGLIYGMGAKGFRRYAKSQYGLDLSEAQAAAYRAAFFRAYPGLAIWHQQVRAEHSLETRTLAGRRRFIPRDAPDTWRLNSPVQGTGADGLKRAMGLLWARRDQAPGAVPVLAVHDELVVECDATQAEQAAVWLRQAMLDGMAGWLDPVPVEVETTIGPTWGG